MDILKQFLLASHALNARVPVAVSASTSPETVV
jgi:hypothetical protein